MRLFRLRVRLTAPLGTPLVGPTLFGQLCWLRREAEGDAALSRWLAQPETFWRLSDGFPADCLPKPLTRPRLLEKEALDDVKARKKRPYVRRDRWLKHRHAWDEARLELDDLVADTAHTRRIAHNVVDRHGRGTLEQGGLFFLDEDWRFSNPETSGIDLYVQSPEPPETVRALLAELGRQGYGRDASTGRGRFEVETIEPDDRLLAGPPGASRRMSLSRGCLTPLTMRDAYWRIAPHFGRAGPQVALAGTSTFKHPALLTLPGATFAAGEGEAGRWLTGLHPTRPEIGLNGLHLAIPFAEAER